ncbi:Gfo/Idh/MocA family oxidoreductase [Sunxiuqinia sp. A32]|uniref:Gfo/Idh/MocA family oxidoreductase n=1 Tax=Sunxiuqinia sp. A32 TaxID=3461496 RepID=UPI0040459C82
MKTLNIGFLGAGGIARAHAFALNSIQFYYQETPTLKLVSVCSQREESRTKFAKDFGFEKAETFDQFIKNESLDAVLILGPNKVHAEHLKAVHEMPNVTKIYLEKPVCSSLQEEQELSELISSSKKIQIGFQFLQMSAMIKALKFWSETDFGKPIHFSFRYLHADYLKLSYRDKRRTRLTPAPDGGAMADLGSHAISLMLAFLGKELTITSAVQGGNFEDVDKGSDLFSEISLIDKSSGAVGHLNASRVSSGTGDLLAFEIYAEKGAIRFHSHQQDYFEYYLEDEGNWVKVYAGSDFSPHTSFPSGHVPSGWLRSMIHGHYLFLLEPEGASFVPDLSHGLEVQRLVRETAAHLLEFRNRFQ